MQSNQRDTREVIIQAAMKTFIEQGLYETVMDNIAEEAGVTRRTLYRYVQSKEELAYEVAKRILSKWNNYYTEVFFNLEGTGLTRLERFLKKMVHYIEEQLEGIRYLSEFDFYFKDRSVNNVDDEQINDFDKIILLPDSYMLKLVQKGIDDGSIKENCDIHKLIATMSNVLWSFGQRIAIRRKIIEKETSFDAIDLMMLQIDLYIKVLKGY